MKITKAKNPKIEISSFSEFKYVVLKLKGGNYALKVTVIINEKVSENEIKDFFAQPVERVYLDKEILDMYSGMDVLSILGSCQFELEDYKVETSANKTTIDFIWCEDH